jgi:hypothetical protein
VVIYPGRCGVTKSGRGEQLMARKVSQRRISSPPEVLRRILSLIPARVAPKGHDAVCICQTCRGARIDACLARIRRSLKRQVGVMKRWKRSNRRSAVRKKRWRRGKPNLRILP